MVAGAKDAGYVVRAGSKQRGSVTFTAEAETKLDALEKAEPSEAGLGGHHYWTGREAGGRDGKRVKSPDHDRSLPK